MGDAIAGWLIAFVTAALFGGLLLSAAGYDRAGPTTSRSGSPPIANVPLWIGFVRVPIVGGRHQGQRLDPGLPRRDQGVRRPARHRGRAWPPSSSWCRWSRWPILKLTNTSVDELEKPARELADKANGLGGALLFILLVGLFAPVAEELFFRGLVFRSLEKRWNRWWALGISSVVFGATHFEPLQFAALTAAGAVFGYLVIRTGRLGPAIVAHIAFNLSTVTVLLWAK